MKNKIIITILALFFGVSMSYAWGPMGHDVVAAIAEQNLNKKAKKALNELLDGKSIVYYSSWMDNIQNSPYWKNGYDQTKTWHYANVDKGFTYQTMKKNEKGDVVSALNRLTWELTENYDNLTDSMRIDYVKMIIHMVGDMHCPAHIYYLGRNQNYKVKFGGGYIKPVKEMKIHTVWDEAAIQSSRIWSVSEWAEELDRKSAREIRSMVAGTPQDWLEDNARRCLVQFDMAAPGGNVAQDFVNEALPLIETQILYAGYRLAAILNGIF